jgi:hypothetical protein
MSGGGVSTPSLSSATANTPQIQPLKNPLVGVPQPLIGAEAAAGQFAGGSGAPIKGFLYPYFSASGGGNVFNPSNNTLSYDTSWGIDPAVSKLNDTFQQGAAAFGALGQTVQPGFSLFRQTGLQDIENSRQQTQSNLQQNLAQRRVQGSSFANSSISNANADFAQKSADFIAQSYLQELQASMQTTQAQYDMSTKGYNAVLQQMNVNDAMAAQMSSQMAGVMASVAETQGSLDLSAAQTNAQGSIAQAQLITQEQQMMLQASEFNAQLQASEMMGVGQLAGGLLGSGMGKSDRRVKRDIKQIGEWLNGLPIYLFRYIFDPRWFIGFMAQDVEKVMPEAVFEIGGIKHVNYRLAIMGAV